MVFGGCGGAASSSAVEAAFDNYLAAVRTKKMSNIGTYVTGWQHKKLLGQGAIRRIKMYEASLPKEITVIEVKIVGEGTAVVYVQAKRLDNALTMKGHFDMLLEGNIWKVNKETWDLTQ